MCKVSAPVSLPAGAAKFHPFVVVDQRSFWLACISGSTGQICFK